MSIQGQFNQALGAVAGATLAIKGEAEKQDNKEIKNSALKVDQAENALELTKIEGKEKIQADKDALNDVYNKGLEEFAANEKDKKRILEGTWGQGAAKKRARENRRGEINAAIAELEKTKGDYARDVLKAKKEAELAKKAHIELKLGIGGKK